MAHSGTKIVEITLPGWHSFFRRKAAKGAKCVPVQCSCITPEGVWKRYAKLWFNYDGVITDEWKEKLGEMSHQVHSKVQYDPTVWRDSDTTCNNTLVLNAILA